RRWRKSVIVHARWRARSGRELCRRCRSLIDRDEFDALGVDAKPFEVPIGPAVRADLRARQLPDMRRKIEERRCPDRLILLVHEVEFSALFGGCGIAHDAADVHPLALVLQGLIWSHGFDWLLRIRPSRSHK